MTGQERDWRLLLIEPTHHAMEPGSQPVIELEKDS